MNEVNEEEPVDSSREIVPLD